MCIPKPKGVGVTTGVIIGHFPQIDRGRAGDAERNFVLNRLLVKLLTRLGLSSTLTGKGLSVTVNAPQFLDAANGNGLLVDITITFTSQGSGLIADSFLAAALAGTSLIAGEHLLADVLKPFATVVCQVVCESAQSSCVDACRAAPLYVVPFILTVAFECDAAAPPPRPQEENEEEAEEAEEAGDEAQANEVADDAAGDIAEPDAFDPAAADEFAIDAAAEQAELAPELAADVALDAAADEGGSVIAEAGLSALVDGLAEFQVDAAIAAVEEAAAAAAEAALAGGGDAASVAAAELSGELGAEAAAEAGAEVGVETATLAVEAGAEGSELASLASLDAALAELGPIDVVIIVAELAFIAYTLIPGAPGADIIAGGELAAINAISSALSVYGDIFFGNASAAAQEFIWAGDLLAEGFKDLAPGVADAFKDAGGIIASEATILGTEVAYHARLVAQEAAAVQQEADNLAKSIAREAEHAITDGFHHAVGYLDDVASFFGRRRLASTRPPCAPGTFSFSTGAGVRGGGGNATEAALAEVLASDFAVNVSLCASTVVKLTAPLFVTGKNFIACSSSTVPPSCAFDGANATRLLVVTSGSLTLSGVTLQARAAAPAARCSPALPVRTVTARWAAPSPSASRAGPSRRAARSSTTSPRRRAALCGAPAPTSRQPQRTPATPRTTAAPCSCTRARRTAPLIRIEATAWMGTAAPFTSTTPSRGSTTR